MMMSGSFPCRLFDFLQDGRAFRNVRRAAAGQDQFAVHIFLGKFAGQHDSQRIFQPGEALNLGHDGGERSIPNSSQVFCTTASGSSLFFSESGSTHG